MISSWPQLEGDEFNSLSELCKKFDVNCNFGFKLIDNCISAYIDKLSFGLQVCVGLYRQHFASSAHSVDRRGDVSFAPALLVLCRETWSEQQSGVCVEPEANSGAKNTLSHCMCMKVQACVWTAFSWPQAVRGCCN